MKRRLTLFIFCCIMPCFALAAVNNQAPVLGKQYKKVTPTLTIPTRFAIPKGKILVVEFFSYGCPWCFHLEPTLERWLRTKPKDVVFQRVPVVFENGWQVYAKAYYTAKALGVLNKMTPAIFNAIHVKNMNLASKKAMENFFVQQSVSKKDFISAYDFSPGIGAEMDRGRNLMLAYKVFQVPTLIIDGKYMTNTVMTDGDDKQLIQVINYLVNKQRLQLQNKK